MPINYLQNLIVAIQKQEKVKKTPPKMPFEEAPRLFKRWHCYHIFYSLFFIANVFLKNDCHFHCQLKK